MPFYFRKKTVFILLLLFLFFPGSVHAEFQGKIRKLKNLYLDTVLVANGIAKAVIVAPSDGRYKTSVRLISDKIRKLTGVRVHIYADGNLPGDILQKYNVLVLGNMATNRFIERLYCQWYCLLDLKYPGRGGYVVRSLHNPYGTGHNVILIGGSDDQGVEMAAYKFVDLLKKGTPLKVGWLMKIKLGEGMNPPQISLDNVAWNVYSWRDSYRKTKNGKVTGYKPSTYFGWNPISIAGILYYMTGQKRYLDAFKAIAMPDPNHIPAPNLKSEAFYDPLDPLVKNYHYRSHLVDCVWDLIEESPLFTDSERLFITNKLLEHQRYYDPTSTFSKPHGDRHACWQMMNIYTGSRYFSKYYPDPIWEKRIDNVRRAFHSFISDPTWGERDTLYWVSTSIEPVFDFFTMDGPEEFVKSGTAETMMQALKVLMSGREKDDYNRYVSIDLLHKAGYLLKDGSYYWMARQLGFDFNTFRIGQSYWPPDDITIKSPAHLVNRIALFPLARKDWERVKKPIPLSEAFEILSYRTGLGAKDDYFLIDGFNGLGRNPFHLNTIYDLRMFRGKGLLKGYLSDVDIWFNGSTELNVARAAALKESFVNDHGKCVYIKTEVPDMSYAAWQRHVLYLKDKFFLVIDKVTTKKEGHYDVVASWQLGSRIKSKSGDKGVIITSNGIRLANAGIPICINGNTLAQEVISKKFNPSEDIFFANVLGVVGRPKDIGELKPGAYLVGGEGKALVCVGDFDSDNLIVDADFAYVDHGSILLTGARTLSVKGRSILHSDAPVTLFWNLREHLLRVMSNNKSSRFFVATPDHIPRSLKEGEYIFNDVRLNPYLMTQLSDAIKALSHELLNQRSYSSATKKTSFAQWEPQVDVDSKKGVSLIEPAWPYDYGNVWKTDEQGGTSYISLISSEGKVIRTIRRKGKILSMWAANGHAQARSFALLVGYRDDTLEAISKDGKTVWRVKAKIDPSFRIGDRYRAPWFTDPGPRYRKTGIYSILVGHIFDNAREEIVIGRPCTVEFRRLDGRLIARVPTRWGDNTSLAVLRKRGDKEPLLLVGKYFTGNPGLSGITNQYKNISDNLFTGLPPGLVSMHAWLQRGLSDLVVTDLDGDGIEEVIYTLSGHWNELRVYSGATGKPLWVRYFGPGRAGDRFMRGLQVVDRGDGSKEIVVATKMGLVCAFDKDGNQIWHKIFDCPVHNLDGAKVGGKTMVGLSDGTALLLSRDGKIIKKLNKIDGPVRVAIIGGRAVVFGKDGEVKTISIEGKLMPPTNIKARVF